MILRYFKDAESESGWCNSYILGGFEIYKMAAKMAAGRKKKNNDNPEMSKYGENLKAKVQM